MDCKTEGMLSDFFGVDLMVFQRQHRPESFALMRRAQRRGIKAVYDLDDDLFSVPPEVQPAHSCYALENVQQQIREFLRYADAVVVSTRELEKVVVQHTVDTPVYVLENTLDAEMWDMPFTQRQAREPGPVTIGYAGSHSHVPDLVPILPALERVMESCEDVRLHFVGWPEVADLSPDMFELYADRIQVDGWAEIHRLPFLMRDMDIGLAPLRDNRFNRSRSGIKALQYWGLGIPVVVSPLPGYKLVDPNVNGLFANFEHSWERALEMLIADAPLRRRMGMAGRVKMLERYDIRRRAEDWLQTFEEIRRG